MSLNLPPGDGVICKVNAHRTAWNGTICQFPLDWDCGTKEDFRMNKCDHGIPRCFHLNVFNPEDPVFLADWNGIDWVLREEEDQLDDQILLFWSNATREMSGIRHPERRVVVGAYRVKGCEQRDSYYTWTIRPYEDGWVRFPNMDITCPAHSHAGGNYLRVVEGRLITRLFDTIDKEVESGGTWHDPGDKDRFAAFNRNLSQWLEAAAEQRQRWLAKPRPQRFFSLGASDGSLGASGSLRAQLSRLHDGLRSSETARGARAPATDEPAAGAGATPLAKAPAGPEPLIGEAQHQWIAEVYGESVARSIAIGTLTKPFLVLRGPTGVGKSYLARHLVAEDRFLLVPVGATWRGREDLLGYVNPVSGEFEATPVTRFLHRAACAWEAGSREPWVVVFDEFNLSQPEHWLTDVLSLGQASENSQRLIELGGKGFEVGGQETRVTRILLSKAVRFVATINNDHTVLPLSPRVLDRASLVELPMTPVDAIKRAGVDLDHELLAAITDLDYELRTRGTTFSIRTAQSLGLALEHRARLLSDEWTVLDHVLSQEVLSKIRLHAGDPTDVELLERLKGWQENHGSKLSRCAALLEMWKEQLDHGTDVIQA